MTQQYDNQQRPQVYQVAVIPTIATTLLITLFFGLFGLIPAVTHTSRARAMGQPTNKYWITFGAVMGVAVVFTLILIGGGAH